MIRKRCANRFSSCQQSKRAAGEGLGGSLQRAEGAHARDLR
jgi:hypothetical protein